MVLTFVGSLSLVFTLCSIRVSAAWLDHTGVLVGVADSHEHAGMLSVAL
jgi:hypothetical protein